MGPHKPRKLQLQVDTAAPVMGGEKDGERVPTYPPKARSLPPLGQHKRR